MHTTGRSGTKCIDGWSGKLTTHHCTTTWLRFPEDNRPGKWMNAVSLALACVAFSDFPEMTMVTATSKSWYPVMEAGAARS